jgi:acetylornithine deacetylase/succinyl-diaminopimelate desuccinylase-like protein
MRILIPLLLSMTLSAQTADQQLARGIFKQLIEIDTTDSAGDNTRAADAMAERFRAAGFTGDDVKILEPAPRKGNLVVRLHGTGQARPILFIGHLDVVEAKRSDWSVDPFVFLEKDGYFYGRGTEDMKGDDTTLIAAFLRMKRENFRLARDLILALTSDEEGGSHNGVDWLVKNHRDLIDAEFCINPDAGGGDLKNGKRKMMGIEAAEKIFVSFRLQVTNPGGHSSLPSKDNAIYHLAGGLNRLAAYDFPVHLFDVTRAEFERMAPLLEGQLGADLKTVAANSDATTPEAKAAVARLSAIPLYNALMRTTCVPTMLSGGHAENALPQTATAVVNCRVLPADVDLNMGDILKKVLADPKIDVQVMTPAKASKLVPMNPAVLGAVTSVTNKYWPGVPVVPKMDTGASDGVYLNVAGIPTYGVSGIFGDEDDVRAHGRDERILVQSFYEALPFMYDLATTLGRGQ